METTIWDASKYLATKKQIKGVLQYIVEDCDTSSAIAITLYDVARARGGVRKLAKETSVPYSKLNKIILGEEEATIPVLKKILKAFDLKLIIK